MKTGLFVVLGLFTAGFIVVWAIALRREQLLSGGAPHSVWARLCDGAIGFITNFFDALGIGSFATTTSIFRLLGLVRDEQIPGTLNVGHTLPSILEAFIYVAIVQVDPLTMILMIAASVVGAWFGAGVVARWPRRNIQVGMGLALLATAGFMLMSQVRPLAGGETLGLTGVKLAIAVVANMILGALMTLGIGLFAPCMVIIYLMGMNLRTAFPIMMGSCAFLMPVGSIRFIRGGRYNLKSALGLAIGGIPGVLLAAFIVKSLPLSYVTWLVIAVVIYTAVTMLRSAIVERSRAALVESKVAST